MKELKDILDSLSVLRNRNTHGAHGDSSTPIKEPHVRVQAGSFHVYVIACEVGKVKRAYVGQTQTPKRRLDQHNGKLAGW